MECNYRHPADSRKNYFRERRRPCPMPHTFCPGSVVLGGTQSLMARGKAQRANFVENFLYCGNKPARTPNAA
jgi:hypothetical protein